VSDIARIQYTTSWRERRAIVSLSGELTSRTYGMLRDTLVTLAMEEPRAVIAQVDDLQISSVSTLTVFSSAWLRVGDWPGVPIIVVATSEPQRSMLAASPMRHLVPVFADVDSAVASVDRPPMRRRAHVGLAPVAASSRYARRFVYETCERWQVSDVTEDAMDIATELVENAIVHAGTPLRLRMDLRSGLLTVAVSDDDPHEAVLREQGEGDRKRQGLRILAALASVWGCTPESSGGKVVWAMLVTAHRRGQPLDPAAPAAVRHWRRSAAP
jgi:hypothetical protein